MAAASCSSAGISRRGLVGRSPVPCREIRQLKLCAEGRVFDVRGNDIGTSQPHSRNHPCVPRTRPRYFGGIAYVLSFGKGKGFGSDGKNGTRILKALNFKGYSPGKKHTSFVKAVATVEQKWLVPSENGHIFDASIQFSSNLDSPVSQTLNEDSLEMDERERLRRMKISKANKGNVPWNKGRKHSPETLRRIRERTKIAMQDPKVKMKLVKLGHAQSEETRMKIGVGVREGWQRRRKRLMVQESCVFEWQNMIAEASRRGCAGESELQWDSYTILDEKLKQEWLESIEKRKSMPRPKGSKRAAKSLEQRKKISEAITAKWADPEYRDRVCAALAKYHGTPIGAERRPRRKPTGESSSVIRESLKKKSLEAKGNKSEASSIKKVTTRKKRNATPSYKDPMASLKLEMIKKIREERAAMETRKREATEKAKLLIAEAEKAAKALEMAALKSPLAQASLLEARKLIAEATRSIESIETRQSAFQDNGDVSPISSGIINHLQAGPTAISSGTSLDERIVNGTPLFSNWSDHKDFDFNKFTLKTAMNARERLPTTRNGEISEELGAKHSLPMQPGIVKDQPDATESQVSLSGLNGSAIPKMEEEKPLETKTGDSCTPSSAKIKKKWVCGRLVEVED